MSGIEKGEAELSSLTVKTTGHKCPNDGIFEALVKQFGEGEISVVIICEALSFICSSPTPRLGARAVRLHLERANRCLLMLISG